MNALIAGAGSVGLRHLANLRVLCPDVSVTVWHQHRRPGATPNLPGADHVVFELDAALASNPDLALITGPAPLHVSTALPLADRGVHLFIEKPLSNRLDDVEALLDTCARNGVTLLVGYNLRFSRSLQEMKRATAAGLIGRVLSVRAEVGQYLPDWRPNTDYRTGVSARSALGGGALMELSHEIDYVRWLVGEVREVYARIGRVSDLEVDVDDIVEFVLEFETGAIGNIHLDMVQRAPTRTCRLIGTEGTLTWDGLTGCVAHYSSAVRTWTDLLPATAPDRNEMYVAELRHFLDCVRHGATPLVAGIDGRRVLEIALAAKQSSSERRAIAV